MLCVSYPRHIGVLRVPSYGPVLTIWLWKRETQLIFHQGSWPPALMPSPFRSFSIVNAAQLQCSQEYVKRYLHTANHASHDFTSCLAPRGEFACTVQNTYPTRTCGRWEQSDTVSLSCPHSPSLPPHPRPLGLSRAHHQLTQQTVCT